MSEQKNTQHLNLRRSPKDKRDYIVKLNEKKITLKSQQTADLRTYCTTVKNQGSVGSCTAFATIGLLEYLHKKKGKLLNEDMYSEQFNYYSMRVDSLGWPASEDSGGYLRNAVDSALRKGVCFEKTFPYNQDYKTVPPQSAYDEATKNQVIKYARLDTDDGSKSQQQVLEDALTMLEQGYPFVGGFVCYDNLWDTKSDGRILSPTPKNYIIGGHAVFFCGFDRKRKEFLFKNSWGTGWGDKGYGRLPFKYLLDGLLWDLWCVFSQEANDDNSFVDISTNNNSDNNTDNKKGNPSETKKKWAEIVTKMEKISTRQDTQTDSIEKVRKSCNELYNIVNSLESSIKSEDIKKEIKQLQSEVIKMYDIL